jgi:hypothetical protein
MPVRPASRIFPSQRKPVQKKTKPKEEAKREEVRREEVKDDVRRDTPGVSIKPRQLIKLDVDMAL